MSSEVAEAEADRFRSERYVQNNSFGNRQTSASTTGQYQASMPGKAKVSHSKKKRARSLLRHSAAVTFGRATGEFAIYLMEPHSSGRCGRQQLKLYLLTFDGCCVAKQAVPPTSKNATRLTQNVRARMSHGTVIAWQSRLLAVQVVGVSEKGNF